MNITYSKGTGELCPTFSRFSKILITALTLLLVLVSSEAISQAGTPCTAHRWNAGDGWRLNTTTNKWEAVVLSAPSLQPKGIVRCASSAETESQLQQFKGTFHAATSPAILSGGGSLMDCFDQGTETFGNAVAKPTEGEDIVWFNFDIRPLAGTYQFQVVTNQSVGWALFYSNKPAPINGVTPGTVYPAGGGLSGDCSDLTYANVNGHGGCGLSGNGWSTITVPSFLKPSNYYLAMWMASPAVTTFPNNMNLVYKSRFGCGGATCTLEFLKKELSCAENGYTVCATYGGSAGKWGIVDNAPVKATSYTYTTYKQDGTTVVATGSSNNLTTTPLSFILGTVADDGALFVKICATYANGNAYNISLVPDGSYTTGSNYVACTSGGNFFGTGVIKHTVTATATPSTLVLKDNILSSILHANVSGGSGDYAYSWQQLTVQGNTSFTNTNTADATFSILNTDLPLASQYDFKVTVTDNITGCVSTALVSVLLDLSAPPCTITGTPPACPSGLQQFTGPTDADITAYEWKISEYGEVPTGANPPADGSTIDGSSTSQTVKVKPGSNCKVAYRLTVIATAGLTKTTCFIDVQIEDTKNPVFTFCPPGGYLGCNPTGVPAPGDATATDDCGDPTITSSLGDITSDGCLRSQTRTYTATDGCGHTATCAQVFTWKVDILPPVFTFCPPGDDLGCNPTGVPAPGAATATDACGAPIITSALGSISSNGCQRSQTRTYTATDGCGNQATCYQVFTWTVDVEPPVLTCAANGTLECGSEVTFTPPTVKDNCDPAPIISIVSTVVDGNTSTRTWKATDACGNVSTTCSQSVTVGNCNHTFPTQTTCCNFVTKTASPLLKVCYTVTANKVSNAVPGVFFYYTTLVAPSANFKVDVEQSKNVGSFSLFSVQNANQVRLFTSDCNTVNIVTTVSNGNTSFTVTGATPGATYIVSVKYDTKSIIGSAAAGLPTVTYTFKTFTTTAGGGIKTLVPGSTGTMDAVANCTDNTPDPGVCTTPTPTIAKRLPDAPVVSEQLEATAFPNPAPARGSFNLRIVSPVSGNAVIEYFSANGAKVLESKKLVKAHVPETVRFDGSFSITGAILYKVSVGDKSVKGMVIRPN